MFDFEVPSSREEIRAALGNQEVEITDYLATLSTEEFFAPQGGYWSPAGHLRHLIKTLRAVGGGLGQSRAALLLFGRSKSGSRSYDAVVSQYLAAIEGGVDAGKYGPSDRVPDLTPDAWRSQIIDRWGEAGSELRKALLGWSEEQLDRYRLPHPLIGKLTLRELLLWTLYHSAHHARRIRERAGETA